MQATHTVRAPFIWKSAYSLKLYNRPWIYVAGEDEVKLKLLMKFKK